MVLFILFSILFLALIIIIWRIVTKKPDFEGLEINSSIDKLIQLLLDEASLTLASNKTEFIHKFNPNEPPIDGEIAVNVTFKVAQISPCMMIFSHETNGDVKVTLQKIE